MPCKIVERNRDSVRILQDSPHYAKLSIYANTTTLNSKAKAGAVGRWLRIRTLGRRRCPLSGGRLGRGRRCPLGCPPLGRSGERLGGRWRSGGRLGGGRRSGGKLGRGRRCPLGCPPLDTNLAQTVQKAEG